MAATLTAVLNEINADPMVMGYGGKSHSQIAALLNQLTGPGAASVFRNDVAPKEIVQAIAQADFTAANQLSVSKLQLIFAAAPIDCTLANVRGSLQSLFSGASQGTKDALVAVASKTGSRAEVLFGTGTVITAQQVSDAKGGV